MGRVTDMLAVCALTVIFTEAALPVIPETRAYKYSKAVAECESELPRNQKCEIYARPVEVK